MDETEWRPRFKAELICYDVNGIHIVFGVTEEKAAEAVSFFDVRRLMQQNLCRKPDELVADGGNAGSSD